MYFSNSDPLVDNTVIFGNTATNGAGMLNIGNSNPHLIDVIFSANTGASGGGMSSRNSDPYLLNVVFAGNSATFFGGGLFNVTSQPDLINVVLAGNTLSHPSSRGAGIYSNNDINPSLINVTISGNTSQQEGGGVYTVLDGGFTDRQSFFENLIIWGNTASENDEIDSNVPANSFISHANIRGCGESGVDWDTDCGTDDGNNIDTDDSPFVTDPLAPSITGTWTLDPDYDGTTLQTTFVDTDASWASDELIGLFIQPDINDGTRGALWFPIVSNTATTINVWGDSHSWVNSGNDYAIHDLHLIDGSACIDTGSNDAVPDDDLDLDSDQITSEKLPYDIEKNQRFVNGDESGANEVDMGAYEYQTPP